MSMTLFWLAVIDMVNRFEYFPKLNLRGLDSQFKGSLIFEFSNDWRLGLRSNFYRFRES